MKYTHPPIYTFSQLEEATKKSKEQFKRERALTEKRWSAFYTDVFNETLKDVDEIFSLTNSLVDFKENCCSLLQEGKLNTLRYMCRPTVSADDFKNLSETYTTSPRKLSRPQEAAKAGEFLERNLNDDVFPWLKNKTAPTDADLLAAKRAVASLVAEQKTKTEMRNKSSKTQEEAVREALVEQCDYKGIEGADFDGQINAPQPGQFFLKETKVAGTKADVVLGLHDGRFMAIECKVSNTEVNSYKRLNHEAVDKISKWNAAFGSNGVVGAVVLQGVFKTEDLESAQEKGAAIFWTHDMQPLTDFINGTKQ